MNWLILLTLWIFRLKTSSRVVLGTCLLSLSGPDSVSSRVSKCLIPFDLRPGNLVWNPSPTGDLTLQLAYEFQRGKKPSVSWHHFVWSNHFPPSKFFMAWRLILDKIPTDENLIRRGFLFSSACSLCNASVESSQHLFFECPFVAALRYWLSTMLDCRFGIRNWEDVWQTCGLFWSGQCATVVHCAILHLFNVVWIARNNMRFHGKLVSVSTSTNFIMVACSTSWIGSKAAPRLPLSDFAILKKFHISILPLISPRLVEVIWKPPPWSWIKAKCDGASSHNPGNLACEGLFRDHNGNFVGAFSRFLGV
ncbi:uncharacterized protein LOC131646348 [Vicia villosa]|uniref:uncharacterized protein LOC131646348 n=1 Tax=Vicia villosa TaxID=3911 RepID=UPI00273CC504|nr:uncharacterized protein LOC131646348 [Vicia villosa]